MHINLSTAGVTPPFTDESFEGKVVVLNIKVLTPKYQTPENQFWVAQGGFGCNPKLIGTAVWSKALADGEETRWERYDFIGTASVELVKQYFPEYEG